MAHVKSHFAIAAPAYGSTAKTLGKLCDWQWNKESINNDIPKKMDIELELTRMAGGKMETNEDIENRVKELRGDPKTKIVFFSCAITDYMPDKIELVGIGIERQKSSKFGKYEGRLKTSVHGLVTLDMRPALKIIGEIRKGRKDIFLVGFKTTCDATRKEMYLAGLNLCKTASVNLVLVNDTKTRLNMIVTPEEAAYHETTDRQEALKNLVEMTYMRSHLTFTQSTVVSGAPVKWDDEVVPSSLREVVNYCIKSGAYKKFNGATVGHFAVKISDTEFLTSIRKSNFNELYSNGLVRVKTDGPDTVVAYGAKPSVGGQSQRTVFKDHPGFDCIVHFHCPFKESHRDSIPIRSQREVECGSHECGKNTSSGLKQFGNLKAVYLDKHGPNIVFNHNIDPQEVKDFIDANFDLSLKTGGYQL